MRIDQLKADLLYTAYGLALVLPFLALGLHYILIPTIPNLELIFLYPCIFIVAWLAGKGPGMFSTIVATLIANYFLIPPAARFGLGDTSARISLFIFASMGIGISFMMDKVHREKKFYLQSIELAKSRSFLDSLLENLPNMVFVKDAKELRFVRFNRAGEDLLGFERKDLIGKNDFDFFPPEQADFFITKDRLVLAEGSVVNIPEEPIQTKYKGRRILHTKKIPIYGPDGTPHYLLGVSEDITEKKKAEDERLVLIREQVLIRERERAGQRSTFLGEASTLMAASFDYHESLAQLAKLSIPVLADWCIFTLITENGNYEQVISLHVSPEKAPLLQGLAKNCILAKDFLSAEDVINKNSPLFRPNISDSDLVNFAKDQRHLQIVKELGIQSCMIIPISSRAKCLGAMTFVSGPSGRIYDNEELNLAEELGHRVGMAIENAHLYKAAQKAIRMRDEFLSLASHELKTPITSIKLQNQMIQRSLRAGATAPSSQKLENALQLFTKQIDRLTNLIEDLLDVTSLQAGRATLNKDQVQLRELVEDVVERFCEQIKESGCPIRIEIAKDIVGHWDRLRIEQVLMNILNNAIKYAPGKLVKISAHKKNNMAVITVRDHGQGISEDKLTTIFERFERSPNSKNISGLGLGLFIAKQIVEGHKGQIYVDPLVKDGASFIVKLPLG